MKVDGAETETCDGGYENILLRMAGKTKKCAIFITKRINQLWHTMFSFRGIIQVALDRNSIPFP